MGLMPKIKPKTILTLAIINLIFISSISLANAQTLTHTLTPTTTRSSSVSPDREEPLNIKNMRTKTREELRDLKEQARDDFQVSKEKFKENAKLNREALMGSLNEIQTERLETFKRGAALAETRLLKAIELLSTHLAKQEERIAKKKTDGFDTTQLEAKVAKIKNDIAAAKVKISQIKPLYQNIESLSLEQMKVKIKEAKTLTKSIITDLKKIKANISSLNKDINAN